MGFFKRKSAAKEKKASATGALISMHNIGQPVWSERNFESYAREAYGLNPVAHRCIKLIASNIGQIEFQLFSGEGKNAKLIEKHPLLALLKNPNAFQSQSEFLESIISFRLISGNSYIEAAYPSADLKPSNRPPYYLYSLRPDRIQIIKGLKGEPAAYQYEYEGAKIKFPVTKIGLSNIMHIRGFNPINDWYGMSDIEAGAYAIDQHNSASAWNQALLQNNAKPSGALVFKGKGSDDPYLTEDQYQRLRDDIEEKYTSPRNAGKPLLLEGGLEWQEMSLSPKDMDWLEGKNSVARDIALAFGVPAQLLGIPGDSTYNNMQEARLSLFEQTITPLLNELLASLNNWLVPRYGDNLTLSYNKDKIDALRIKREMQRTSLDAVSFMTINEKRAAMGLEPLDGGDELLVDSNKIPVNLANQVDNTETAKQLYIKSLKELKFSDAEIKKMIEEDL